MLFLGNHYQAQDSNGKPLSGGALKFFEPDTSTPKDVYSDAALTTSIGSEVTLDAAGRATLFLDGEYKVRLEDSEGVEIQTTDGVNRQEVETSEGINNPSFETEGTSSTDIPGWTLSAPSGVTVERVTTDSYHGEACLEITSDGTNAGYAETEDFISVSPGREYEVSFALESSSAGVTNVVQVRWFDENQSLVSTDAVYNEISGNPTSWDTQVATATPPASARYAKVRMQLGSTAGETRYDDLGLGFLQTSGDFISNEGTTLPSILSNTLANRPSAGTEGRWYYATDEEVWYRDDGSDWIRKQGKVERVLVRQSDQQTVSPTGLTLDFATAIYEVGAEWWSSDSPTEIVCPRDGVVVISGYGSWQTGGEGRLDLYFRINGFLPPGWSASSIAAPAGSESLDQSFTSHPMEVEEGDIITLRAAHEMSGETLDIFNRNMSVRYIE